MIRKFGFGLMWFVVLYMGFSMAGGCFVGFKAGMDDPNNAAQAGAVAGEAFANAYWPYMLGGAFLLAAFGSAAGILPGTRAKTGQ